MFCMNFRLFIQEGQHLNGGKHSDRRLRFRYETSRRGCHHPPGRTIQIQPWDKASTAPIEKALLEAKIGINPIVTGEIIRFIPELSGERREELCKMAQGFAEQGRISIRLPAKRQWILKGCPKGRTARR